MCSESCELTSTFVSFDRKTNTRRQHPKAIFFFALRISFCVGIFILNLKYTLCVCVVGNVNVRLDLLIKHILTSVYSCR